MVRKNIQKEEVPREEERGFVEGIELITQRQNWSLQQYLASRDLSASQPNISDLSRNFDHIQKTIWELSPSACLAVNGGRGGQGVRMSVPLPAGCKTTTLADY